MKIVGIFLVLYIFCGIRSIECIYGGRNATLGEFPYMVSIREKIGGHYCGGAILNKRYIVTSGACLEFYRNPNELIATAGITSLEEEGTTMDIGKMIKHPHFNMDTLAHDIALLRTAKDIKFGKRITAIGLPTSDLPARGGTTVTVAGWGDTVDGPNYGVLKVLRTKTFDLHICKGQVEFEEQVVDKSSTCTKSKNGAGICQYDQGSPLVDESKQLVGLASWFVVDECGSSVPNVYTRVYPHIKWIKEEIKK